LGDTKSKTNKIRRVDFMGRLREFEIKQVLEFDSTRKKMSIILQDLGSRNYLVFCKGADSSVLKECMNYSRDQIQSAEESITYFGQNGWRTLAFAYKVFTAEDYMKYERILLDAFNDIMNRDEKVANAYAEIETNMVLLGATGIEDKLQDDVEATLEVLRFAGIKIWVLTGDKTETAINISFSCKHFSKSMEKMFLIDLVDAARIKSMLDIFYQKFAFYTFLFLFLRHAIQLNFCHKF
jgi:phospholipid-translocating ATPase